MEVSKDSAFVLYDACSNCDIMQFSSVSVGEVQLTFLALFS